MSLFHSGHIILAISVGHIQKLVAEKAQKSNFEISENPEFPISRLNSSQHDRLRSNGHGPQMSSLRVHIEEYLIVRQFHSTHSKRTFHHRTAEPSNEYGSEKGNLLN